ncbi:hypothetical protein IOK37_26450 [Escherichia coli]|nr:hypothetical protein [Escherichia coli]
MKKENLGMPKNRQIRCPELHQQSMRHQWWWGCQNGPHLLFFVGCDLGASVHKPQNSLSNYYRDKDRSVNM